MRNKVGIFLRVLVGIYLFTMLFSMRTEAQTCASTSPYPWLWPSHQNWFYGSKKKINFPSGTVSTLPGTSLSTYEGTFAVSSDAGALLFYGNGYAVANAAGTTTFSPLVLGLGGTTSNSACQGIITVRHPLNPTVYYTFTTDDAVDGTGAHGMNMYTFSASGAKLSGPTLLKTSSGANFGTTEGIAATKHSNGVDIWIAVHQGGSRTIHSFLLKCTGLSNGVNAYVSNTNAGALVAADDRCRGGMQFSYDGSKFAEAYPFYWDSDPNQHTTAGVSVLKFNNATGVFSNCLYVNDNGDAQYDVEFSPDGNRIYVACSSSNMKTFDLSSWNAATIMASKTNVASGSGYGALQMGGDGSLYYNVNTLKQISGNLNAATGLTVTSKGATGTLGLPNMYLPPQEEPDIHEVGPYCLGDPAVDLSTTWLCSGLNAEDAANYPTEYSGTGITNTGTGIFNPTTAGVGTHQIIFTRCSVDDTIWIVVNPKPNITIANQTICNTDPAATFDAGAGYTYVWSGLGSGTSRTTSGSTAGTYTVIVTDGNGCKDTTSATLTVNTCGCPDTTLSNIASQCSSSGTINLNTYKVTTEAGTWSIQSGGSTATITGGNIFNINNTAAGNYVVRFTLSAPQGGCPTYAERTIVIKTKPNITIANQSVCSGTTATFDAGAGYTYVWSGNGTGTSQTTSGTTAGTYTVIVTNPSGCKDTASATLTVNALPIVSLSNKSICSGASTTFDAGAGFTTYTWSGLGTGASQTTSASTAGTYTVTVTNAANCSASASATLTVNALPIVSLSNKSICSGASTTFDAGAGFTTYTWSGLGTGTSQTTSASTAGTYTVTVTNAANCSASASATLTVNALPIVSLSNNSICSGASTTFDAGAGFTTYTWSGLGTGTSQTTPASTAGTYTVTVTNAANCSASASATLTFNPLPTITISGDTSLCTGETALITTTLTGTAPYSIKASLGIVSVTFNTSVNTTVIPFTIPGNYTLEVTDANGCKTSKTMTIIVNAKPNITLTNATICAGDPAATFDAGVGYTYVWSGNGTGTSQTTSGTNAGTYTVYVTDGNGCKDTANGTLTVNAKPNITLTNATICAGDPAATFDAGAGYTYVWSVNGTGTSQTTSGTTAGTYTVIVTNGSGCKDTASAALTVNSKPNITLTNATVCQGASATFDAGAGYTYVWSGQGTGTSQITSGKTAGTYTVVITDGNGCKDTASATLTVNTKPNITLTNKTICAGDAAATFDAGVGYNYVWGGNGTGTLQTTSGTSAGTYTVVVTDGNGCKDTASATLTVNALPVVNLGSDQVVCAGSPATIFNAGSGFSSYTWNSGGTSSTYTTTVAGTYSVEVVDNNGCKDKDTVVLTVNPLPVINLGADRNICPGSTTTFDAGPGYAFYIWQNNSINQTFTANAAGTYSVTVIDNNNCSNGDTVKVVVSNNLSVNLGPDKEICVGAGAVIFDAGNVGSTYLWSTGATSKKINTLTAGTYSVSVTDPNGCAGKDTVKLTVNLLPVVTLVDAEICYNAPAAIFNAGSFSSYLWSSGETTQTIQKTSAGTYSVAVTDAKGCVNSASATLTVNVKPVFTLGADRSICPGSSTTIDAGSWSAYLWNDNSTLQTFTATNAGNVSVEITDTKGCKAKDTIAITIKNSLTIDLGPDKAICMGDASVTFDAVLSGVGMTYNWNNGAISQTISTNIAGTYIVNVSDAGGCAGKDTVQLVVNALPVVNLGTDNNICLGDPSVTFNAGAGYSQYAWSNNATSSSITVNNAGTYSVEVTDAKGCKDKDTVVLVVNNLPIVNLGADRSICPGTTTTFDAGSFTTYSWNNSTTLQTNTVGVAGNVIVQVTDVNGCKDSDTANVVISNNLTVVLGPDKQICSGAAAVIFDAGLAGANYIWSSGETSQTISKNIAGIYIVNVSTNDGCTGKDTVELIVNALPVVSIPNQTKCLGESATFNAGNFSGYSWLSGEITQTITKSSTGTFTVEVTDSKGCKNTGSTTLTINPLPLVSLSNAAVCIGNSATFDPGSGYSSYSWSSGETSQSITKSTAGKYTVTVADNNGCKDSASANLIVNQLPVVTLSAFSSHCKDDTQFKIAGGAPNGGLYKIFAFSQWTVTDTVKPAVLGAGTHNINYEYTDANGCVNQAQKSIVVYNLPNVSVADQTICAGQMANFDAGAGYSSYSWSVPGGNSRSINVGAAGEYSVVVTDANGCKDRDTTQLTVNPNPVVNLGNDQTVCEGSTVNLSTSVVANSYLWSTGDNGNSITASTSGKYTLTVTDANNCSGSDDVNLTFIQIPDVDLGPDKEICAGQSLTLNANVPNATYNWSTGAKGSSIKVNTSTSVMLTAYFDPKCPNSDTINVIVIKMPKSGLGKDTIVCFNENASIVLDAGPYAEQYHWTDANFSTTQTIEVVEEGYYTVALTNGASCTIMDTIHVNEICISSLYIPNAFSPNADGTNDMFSAKGLNIDEYHLMIFDRWGELLFESFDIGRGWDGTYMGNPCQIEVYVWKLDWISTDAQEMKTRNERVGTVTLIK